MMKKVLKVSGNNVLIIFLFSITSFIAKPAIAQDNASDEVGKPINIILLIGDGMGVSQVSAGFYFQEGPSSFERFPVVGLINTSSRSHKITDSASGATAFACGEKTYNGAIGVDSERRPLPNLVEILSKENYATGLISTSSITHATPASFYAHVPSRSMEEGIAIQLVTSEVDFFAGGGLNFFTGREDGLELLRDLENKGFTVNTKKLVNKKSLKAENKYGFLLSGEGLPKVIEGRDNFLTESTELALHYFDEKAQPFFLMIEGSQIDWAGHNNDADYLIGEQIDFDKVIGKVLDYAEQKGNTLVIVTADHETGGFTLSSKTEKREDGTTNSNYDIIEPTFSTGGHSATLIPVFAFGPNSENFGGVYQNHDIFHKILKIK